VEIILQLLPDSQFLSILLAIRILNSFSTVESLKKCAFSCPGDTSQACGGDGTYISVYYDRTKYTPGLDSIPAPGSSSSGVSSSTSTGTSTAPKPTGPTNLPTIGPYSYIGCYTEATSIRALTGKSYYNDSMTVEMCYTQCTGFVWFGLEYSRECYCGNILQTGSVLSTSGNTCSLTCLGDATELVSLMSR
jgi:iron transport multicopper oxidase